jgi:hypothetical protein
MENQTFETNFNHDNFTDYMCLVFQDKNFEPEELRPSVLIGIKKGLDKYKKKNRTVNFFVYVTYFVKKEVDKYKKSKLLINLSLRKR